MADWDDFTLTMVRGDSRTLTFSVQQTPEDDAAAQDVTGWQFWFTAKRRAGDPDDRAVFQKTVGSGITITAAAGGAGLISIDPADTAGLAGDALLLADLQGEDGAGHVFTPARGTIKVLADATQTS